MKSHILKALPFSSEDAVETTLRLLRARSSRYAWYGTFIACCAVVLACLLVAQHFHGGISYENVLLAQRENVAIWMLDGMPFLFAIWGQAVSFRTTRDAGSAIRVRTSSLRRSLRRERVNARVRTDYFARLSHEFRTPLNSIIGLSDILLRKTAGNNAQEIQIIRGAAENLLLLVNDVLDFSAMEAGRIELDRVAFDLRECITNACSLLQPQARAKSLELVIDVQQELPRQVVGDPGRLRQVLLNLVGNAIKFTDAGSVRCEARISGAAPTSGNRLLRVALVISDTGRGLDAHAMKQLFRPYRRARSEGNRHVEGTGLGLAICREIVEAMGGEITVASESGKGSRFSLELLFEPQQDISIARIARSIEVRGVRLLLVESPSLERDRFEAQLRTLGLDIRTVDDGVEAFKEALLGYQYGRSYELMITDLFVEHLDGESLARALKSRPETRDICLVATTSSGSRGDGRRVKDAGFSGYLAKPIPPEHLGDLLRATLATLAVAEDQRANVGLITRHYIRENAPREVTVLLIEDDPVGLEIARTRLTGLGCHVHSATTAAGALECLATRDFNLVLLDYNLPDGRGDEIVGRIMSQSALSAPPIVMFSAGLTHAEKQRCLRAGAVGFLEKPAPREGLLAVLERHCRLPVATGTEESTEGFAEDVQVTPALRRVFVRESLTRLAELERATGSRMDLDAVHRTAHTMRSSAGHVGAEALARRFAELDRLATEGQERVVRAKVAETIRHWREIIELLEEVEEHEDATVRLT